MHEREDKQTIGPKEIGLIWISTLVAAVAARTPSLSTFDASPFLFFISFIIWAAVVLAVILSMAWTLNKYWPKSAVTFGFLSSKHQIRMLQTKIAAFREPLGAIALIVAIVGIGLAFWQLQLALYQIEYPNLNVTHQLDEENGRLKIFITNTATLKETGTINFYRLEVSDWKPHMQLESLKPGQNVTFELSVKVSSKNFTIPQGPAEWPVLSNFTLPYFQLYFATEDASISYRITCDNCYSQGIIRRIPNWQEVQPHLTIGPNYTVRGSLPTYAWTIYPQENLK